MKMQDLFENKELLRELLKQVDLLNTINGGTIQVDVDLIGEFDSIVIKVVAPTVSIDSFNVMLIYSKLTICLFTKDSQSQQDSDSPFVIPMYMRSFDLPSFADLDKIEAFFSNGELKVVVPYKSTMENMQRMIDIKEL